MGGTPCSSVFNGIFHCKRSSVLLGYHGELETPMASSRARWTTNFQRWLGAFTVTSATTSGRAHFLRKQSRYWTGASAWRTWFVPQRKMATHKKHKTTVDRWWSMMKYAILGWIYLVYEYVYYWDHCLLGFPHVRCEGHGTAKSIFRWSKSPSRSPSAEPRLKGYGTLR